MRDPRTNPKPGDILRDTVSELRVLAVVEDEVEYCRREGRFRGPSCWLLDSQWRERMASAEVVEVVP